MTRIKQLAASEIQKIAAGEVVERPVNVVKELVENAIDAGATSITIMIEQSGKQLIRIIDNGCGMDPEDARLCFQPHTTSKITCVDDLSFVLTFGFRGEALASIASVSLVDVKTKTDTQEVGTHIKLNQGRFECESECALPVGTDISISDLFFNVPARKKFLKSDETEFRAITSLFYAICLTHLSIHFKLIHDGKELYNCPPTDSYLKRASQLWDASCSRHLLDLSKTSKEPYTIEGIISDHVYGKYDRSSLFMFVNNRWVKNQKLISAFIKGYSNVLPQGKYPCGALFITVPSVEVDINIHPRKEEVQFLHPRTIEQLVTNGIKTTLENHLSASLATPVTLKTQERQLFYGTSFEKSFSYQSAAIFTPYATSTQQIPTVAQQPLPAPFDEFYATNNDQQVAQSIIGTGFATQMSESGSKQPVATILTEQQLTPLDLAQEIIVGQLHKTYILLERPDGLFIVDQHAAHERILYEKFSSRFESVSSVTLLFPQIINMPEQEITFTEPFFELLSHSGFIIDRFGPAQLIIHATPVHAKDLDGADLVKQMISWIKEQAHTPIELCKKYVNEKLHAQMACKAAVKAGDELSREQMQQLIADLARCNNRLTCPHGRPTGWLISTYDIEKKFKRIG